MPRAHVLETVDTGARRVCRLSRLSLEKQARAGMSIAAKLRTTQNAIVSSQLAPRSRWPAHSSSPSRHHSTDPATPIAAAG